MLGRDIDTLVALSATLVADLQSLMSRHHYFDVAGFCWKRLMMTAPDQAAALKYSLPMRMKLRVAALG